MNVRILNPKEFKNSSFPTILEDKLEIRGSSNGTSIKFSRTGDYLAVGCYNGTILVFDFETLTLIREFPKGHGKYRYKGILYEPCVSSLSWCHSKRDLYLLSSAWDRQVIIWDIEKKKAVKRLKFNSGVKFIHCHPKKDLFLASPWWDIPYLCIGIDAEIERIPIPIKKECNDTANDMYDYMMAKFDNSGEKIYVGNSYGEIAIYETDGLKLLRKVTVDEKRSSAIYDITFSKKGHFFIVNSGEALHMYHQETMFLIGKFFDVVNQRESYFQHNGIGFSGYCLVPESHWDSRYIYACCRSSKAVYIWDRKTSKLEHFLDGPKENILAVEWHPRSPIIIVSTSSSNLYVWGKTFTEGWSAFAPQFTEIENNEFYTEREDEFDKVDNVDILKMRINPYELLKEGEELDIYTKEKSCFDSDPEDGEVSFISTKPVRRFKSGNKKRRGRWGRRKKKKKN